MDADEVLTDSSVAENRGRGSVTASTVEVPVRLSASAEPTTNEEVDELGAKVISEEPEIAHGKPTRSASPAEPPSSSTGPGESSQGQASERHDHSKSQVSRASIRPRPSARRISS